MFLKFLVDFVKNLHIGDFIKKFFKGAFTDELKSFGTYAVIILQKLREEVDSPAIKEITDLIPGDWDSKVVEAIKNIVPKVLSKAMAGNECLQKENVVDSFSCFAAMVEKQPITERTKIWNGIAFDIGAELFDEIIGEPVNLNKLLIMIPAIWEQLFGKDKK